MEWSKWSSRGGGKGGCCQIGGAVGLCSVLMWCGALL